MHMLGYSREKDGRLPSRISAPNDDDLSVSAKKRLHRRGGVVDAAVLVVTVVVDGQPSILGSSRNDNSTCTDGTASSELKLVSSVALFRCDRLARDRKVDTELQRL